MSSETNKITKNDLIAVKQLLDISLQKYKQAEFIASDPIQVPHIFNRKEDIEISGLLTATISWGNRKSIIKNALELMNLMDNSPYDFIMNTNFENSRLNNQTEYNRLKSFVHRTFNGNDCIYFLQSLKNIYQNHNGLESVFTNGFTNEKSIIGALKNFRTVFLEINNDEHVKKHVSDVSANSAAKRLNMYLRWMVRDDEVDLGIWKQIPASELMLPLDVHTAEVSRAYGLLSRKSNDWKAVEEITEILRLFDVSDPIKYDFALFGIGVFKK